ncbi:hypothetical protein ABK040_000745 [Willaertia magna]
MKLRVDNNQFYPQDSCPQGIVLKNKIIIRLQHAQTGGRLHSHLHVSPLFRQQEVSYYKREDTGDNYFIKLTIGTELKRGDSFRLKHIDTGKYLHTHNIKFGHPIFGQAEVTCVDASNTNTLWVAKEEILLNGIVYSITQLINLFKNPTITNVYPKLVIVNEAITILINSNPNPVNNEFSFTNAGSSLLVRFCQLSIIFNNIIYTNSNQIKTTVTCPSQNTNSILEYMMMVANVTYINAVGSSATGCSIFGKNKVNIQFNNVDAFNKVTTFNSVVELSLFSRQVNNQLSLNDIISCHWSSNNDYQLNCDCPIL